MPLSRLDVGTMNTMYIILTRKRTDLAHNLIDSQSVTMIPRVFRFSREDESKRIDAHGRDDSTNLITIIALAYMIFTRYVVT